MKRSQEVLSVLVWLPAIVLLVWLIDVTSPLLADGILESPLTVVNAVFLVLAVIPVALLSPVLWLIKPQEQNEAQ